MKISDSILRMVLLVFLLIRFTEVYSQAVHQKASRQSALEAFSKNNFELAYIQFSELSASYPKDVLYKYYCGVCLVKLNRDPSRAVTLLQDALQGSAAIRSVPSDGLFYLGRAQQMIGKYSEAIKSYNRYTEQVGKKASRDADVTKFLQQCNEKKGQIAVIEDQKPVLTKKDSINKPAVVTAQKAEKAVRQPVDTIAKQKDLLPEKYDTLLSQALDYQLKADSLSALAAQYRMRIEMDDNAEKANLKTKALNLEQLASSNQKMADQKLAEAQKIAIKPENIMPDTAIEEKMTGQNQLNADSIKSLKVEPKPGMIKDTVIIIKDKQPEKKVAQQADPEVKKSPEIYNMFEIAEKQVTSLNEKVEVNPEVPPGLIYRIQIAVFRNPVILSYFKGITPVFGFKNEGAELTIYYAGMFRKSADATKSLTRVKALGFKDAFVVAMFDKKIVSADRAGILEKEWGTKPLIVTRQKTTEIPHDTVPPTLVFRVEVIRSVRPVAADQMENIKKLAGSRGLDIIMNESKQNIYLIGIFLTFKSASEYADLLVRNGLKEAKVVAYLGKKEIPVETAKQLFEKY